MKITYEKDMFNLFEWFDKNEAVEIAGLLPELSALSIYGIMDEDFEDKEDFFQNTVDIITEKITPLLDKGYKLYLFVADEIQTSPSRLMMYRKIWKKLDGSWNLDGFKYGPELLQESDNSRFFISIAEVDISNLITALKLQHNHIGRSVLYASNNTDVLEEKNIVSFFETALNSNNKFPMFSNLNKTVDYFSLFFKNCPQEDIIFRIGDSSEEMEVDLIFKKEIYEKLYKSN
jgi:hypothetical protein